MREERHPDDRIIAALWVGKPQSVHEYTVLYDSLRGKLLGDNDAPSPIVNFDESGLVPIEELIESFTEDKVFVESAILQAHKKDIKEASLAVLFFSSNGKSLWPDYPPEDDFTYLGLFAFPADEAYKED